MKILNFLRKKTTSKKLYQRFDEVPIWNFNKVCETQDFRYLLKLENYNELPVNITICESVWNTIYFEYLDCVGEDNERAEYRHKYNTFWELYWKQIATNDRKLLNKIDILRVQLNAFQNDFKKEQKGSFDEQVAILDNHFTGVQFDVYKMTAKRYFIQLKIYQDYCNEMEKRHNKSIK